ncbi:major head precursor [Vibrio phage Quinn]|uniref:Major head n=1 Tax=Vibrio phage Quinn TaxID=2736265 RepID=A0A6M9Z2H6_9CAUD|nr:major head precursor [Vibrio phage Quinn]QKN85267.1 major head precursor [Vibrio phage Quinn]
MPMTEKEIAELQEKLGIKTVVDAAKAITDKAEAEAKEKAEKARKAAEDARVKALVDEATGEQKEKLETALSLIKALSGKLEEGDVDGFAKSVEETQNQIKSVRDEVAQLMNAREGKNSIAVAVGKAFKLESQTDFEEEAEKAVLLSFITKKGVFETDFGAKLEKAVNDSSSIQVSSENYETVFSNRILRDIQKLLVVGAMFQELPMSSKKLTMQIEPDAQDATWVDASTYGKETTVGNEIKVALTDITFSTFKLAAKAYMTDETEEDAITALLPIIRRHLIEAHVQAIEKAFMGGEDTAPVGKPTGLLTFAKIDNKRIATTATHDGSAKVTAKMIHQLRRQLGLKGLRLDALALIVSMDAYYDLLEDDEWQDINQVGASASVKLQGQLGRIYGMPVVVSSYFPAKATKKEFCAIVYRNEFVVPRQRQVTVEYERRASEQRDAYYVTQRLNLQRYFTGNVVSGTYA